MYAYFCNKNNKFGQLIGPPSFLIVWKGTRLENHVNGLGYVFVAKLESKHNQQR